MYQLSCGGSPGGVKLARKLGHGEQTNKDVLNHQSRQQQWEQQWEQLSVTENSDSSQSLKQLFRHYMKATEPLLGS